MKTVGKPTAGEVITRAIQDAVTKFIINDMVSVNKDPEAIHQSRVALRKLRSHLTTAKALMDSHWVKKLKSQTADYATQLGELRDLDVMEVCLRQSLKRPHIARFVAHNLPDKGEPLVRALQNRRQKCYKQLMIMREGEQFHDILLLLLDASYRPHFKKRASAPAEKILPLLLENCWMSLEKAAKKTKEDALAAIPLSIDMHKLRIATKRLRYTAEACYGTPQVGDAISANKVVKKAADLQTVLGEYHDIKVFQQWLSEVNKRSGLRSPVIDRIWSDQQNRAVEIEKQWVSYYKELEINYKENY
ncbi:MAG: CHAD domain-containing protein [Actinobacteria bacterium]|nr:CHAD domain-containing protein [Actinomycetota bacterium]MCL6104647.1 CHAD domain-containing protein [Actinomycetota bacterium]